MSMSNSVEWFLLALTGNVIGLRPADVHLLFSRLVSRLFCVVDSSCWFVDFHCWWFQFSSEEPVLTEISSYWCQQFNCAWSTFFSARSSPAGYLDVLRLHINWSCIVFLLPVFHGPLFYTWILSVGRLRILVNGYLFYHLVPSLLCLIWWLDLLAWNRL